jgi:hypothetical protein
MKKFLLKLINYALAISLGYIAIIFSYFFLTRALKVNPYVARDKNVFIVGNSHSQCAIKDTLDIVNFSMGGESVFYSAIKARQILKANPHAIICIEFYPLSIETAYINLADHRLPENYRNYLYFMTAKEHLFLLKYNPWKTARVFFSPNFFSVFNKTGSYLKVNPKLNRSKLPVAERHKFEYKKVWEDKVEMQNFYALLDLIDTHPEALFVLTTMPQSNHLKFEVTTKYQDCLTLLKQRENVCQLDHSGIEYPDSDFVDVEHLNDTGQEKFTRLFAADLEKIRALKGF